MDERRRTRVDVVVSGTSDSLFPLKTSLIRREKDRLELTDIPDTEDAIDVTDDRRPIENSVEEAPDTVDEDEEDVREGRGS